MVLLVVSMLNSESSYLGLTPGQAESQCVVFLGMTLTLTVPLSTQV